MSVELENPAGNTAEKAQDIASEQQQSNNNPLDLASLSSKTIDINQVRAQLNQGEVLSKKQTEKDIEALDPESAVKLDVQKLSAYLELARAGREDLELREAVVQNIADYLHDNVVNNIA